MGVYIKKEVINLSNSDNHARVPIYTNVGDFSVFSTIEKKAMLKKMTKERDYLNSSEFIIKKCKEIKGPFKKHKIKKILSLTRERLELLETRILILRLEIERDKFKKQVSDSLNRDPNTN
jgi:hypothetical protein